MEEFEVVDLDLPLGLLEAIGYSFAERCLGSRVGRCAGKQLKFPFIRPDVLVNRDLTDDHIYLVETEAGWRISGVIDFADAAIGPRELDRHDIRFWTFARHVSPMRTFWVPTFRNPRAWA